MALIRIKNKSILRSISNIRIFLSKFSQHIDRKINKIDWKNNILEINFNSTETLKYNAHWLRFNCHSSKSKQSDSGQRIINIENVSINLKIKKCTFDNDNVYVYWNDNDSDIDQSIIPIDYLIKNYPEYKQTEKKYEICKTINEFDYKDFYDLNGQKNKFLIQNWLRNILLYGIALIKNVPIENGMVGEVAKLIAPIQKTIYGDIFDVISTPNPINIAYSSEGLGLHMDLMYYESSPGIQYLHCIKNDSVVVGGESIFLDSFLAAEKFRKEYPELFDILTKIPATFQKIHFKRERPVYMIYQRPHIVLNHKNQIIAINWSPAFEGPLKDLTQNEIKNYYKSYILFSKYLNNNPNIIEFKLKPGDVVCFNNRRILHGRKGFILNGGIRHLQGCYTNIDEFKSEVLIGEFLFKNSLCDNLQDRCISVGNHDFKDGF